jgi:hypothetical protein
MMTTDVWALVHSAFLAGAQWMEQNTRVVDDGDGRWDQIDPSGEERVVAATEFANRAVGGGS